MDILLVAWDGGGNLPPMLGLGAELRRRGHRVRCLGQHTLRPAVEQAGIEFRPLSRELEYTGRQSSAAGVQLRRMAEILFDDGYVGDLRNAAEKERPDVVVVDCMLRSAQVTAEALGLSQALLVHGLVSFFSETWRCSEDRLNDVRARSGLAPITSVEELWSAADATIVASTPLLDDAWVTLTPKLRYVGPIFEPDGPDTAAVLPEGADASDPVVLVGLSTTHIGGQDNLLRRVIEALRDLPVQGHVTTGSHVDMTSLPTAANVTLHEWLPHNQVLPHAALMITHAGHSSVVRALSHGVPLLCIPLGRDQPFNAERVAAIGAGLALPTDATPTAIAVAVRTLLAKPSYREAAQRASASIAAMGPGAANGADVVEAIAARRR